MICDNEKCFKRVSKYVGTCKLCNQEFCIKHRLPEQHECKEKEKHNELLREKHYNKLMDYKAVCPKVNPIL